MIVRPLKAGFFDLQEYIWSGAVDILYYMKFGYQFKHGCWSLNLRVKVTFDLIVNSNL